MFTSLAEIRPRLEQGVELRFTAAPNDTTLGRLDRLVQGYEIWVEAHPAKLLKNRHKKPGAALQEQKIIFLHELMHLHNVELEDAQLGQPDWFEGSIPHTRYETLCDAAAYEIMEKRSGLVKEIVAYLSVLPNCSFRYQRRTPFYQFHRKIAAELLSQALATPIDQNSQHQMRIIRLARYFNLL